MGPFQGVKRTSKWTCVVETLRLGRGGSCPVRRTGGEESLIDDRMLVTVALGVASTMVQCDSGGSITNV